MGRTDADLVAAARAGDTAAFGAIVGRYQKVVVAVAYAAVRDRVLADDIAQDAFVTAWTKLGGLREVDRLPAWLCGIARNVARARRRVMRREEPGDFEVAGDITPYSELDGRETEAALAAALARVPETYREPLVLFYCEQQPAGEVARALGVSDAAVHQRLSRGRALLAGDAQLVEHAPPRGRRDLAAAVLAAIAIGVGSSRVEAKPRPRGTHMLKLATLALISTLAAGTTYVVARGHSSTPTPAQRAAPSAAAAGPIVNQHASARSQLTLPAFSRAMLLIPHATQAAGAPATCDQVGMHMATLAFDGAADVPPDNTDNVNFAAKHFAKLCLDQHWSADYIACVLGSPDSYSTMLDCAPYATSDTGVETDAPQADGEFMIESRKDAIAPSTDTSCAGVAKHMADLTAPDPAAIAALPADKRQALLDGIAAARRTLPAQIEKGCTDTNWTDARRACMAAATTVADMSKCE